ncbi:hypothetical protein IVB57_09495 [Bradyrhizobium sp. CW9]|uniref:hypothetical protein n=1 Tax=Bradyrhizobium sp. CW9 TaxID=2782689 RepID=UPI001FF87BB2|nr:hypothetical protein [Bradyrhizobium sp. CW9]MCK1328624.1 hypothetical protein [Bradyrhizobium sp. CW9]
MTTVDWLPVIEEVLEAMRTHTLPLVTPLSKDRPDLNKVALLGTGSYVMLGGYRIILTCEHVARHGKVNCGLHGDSEAFGYRGRWFMDPEPVDLALAAVNDSMWLKNPHQAEAIPIERFAQRHAICDPAELLFFLGFAGENSNYGFGVFSPTGSAHLSQEKTRTGDESFFEMYWQPKDTQYSADTTDEERRLAKSEDARGFSGSLVWNTRYLEVTQAGGVWTPADAVVTGMVQRWDIASQTLLVYRVEHIRKWLQEDPAPASLADLT